MTTAKQDENTQHNTSLLHLAVNRGVFFFMPIQLACLTLNKTMTEPQKKAVELIGLYNFTHNIVERNFVFHQTLEESKRCALIAIDLLIYHTEEDSSNIDLYEFYSQVRREILNFGKELKLQDIQI